MLERWHDDCVNACCMKLRLNWILVLFSFSLGASMSCGSSALHKGGPIAADGSAGAGGANTSATGGSTVVPSAGGIPATGGAPANGGAGGNVVPDRGGAPAAGGQPGGGGAVGNVVPDRGGAPAAGGQPWGGASGPVFSTGSGGAHVDCSSIGCNVAPRCGESCLALCGCCPCTAGEVNGDFVCTKNNCYEPLRDGGATCAADAQFACAYGYISGSRGVCGQERVDAVCINGDWACPTGRIPASACTDSMCEGNNPSGPCTAGQGYSCTSPSGYDVSCICEGTWLCYL